MPLRMIPYAKPADPKARRTRRPKGLEFCVPDARALPCVELTGFSVLHHHARESSISAEISSFDHGRSSSYLAGRPFDSDRRLHPTSPVSKGPAARHPAGHPSLKQSSAPAAKAGRTAAGPRGDGILLQWKGARRSPHCQAPLARSQSPMAQPPTRRRPRAAERSRFVYAKSLPSLIRLHSSSRSSISFRT